MSRSKPTRRTKKADILFIVDIVNIDQSILLFLKDKIEELAFDFRRSQRTFLFRFGCVFYRASNSDNEKVFDFNEEIEELASFLDDIQINDKSTEQISYVKQLNKAFNLSWNDGKKIIIWIANKPSDDTKQDMIESFGRLARDDYFLLVLNISGHLNKSFEEIRNIFKARKNEVSKILTNFILFIKF